ncbi:glyoxalase/bleomycin resistance protein/dioxygenase [Oleiphilus messinensis]|uniref:Glyoxalase/bleomycin resistance protein/dioxygenase n=1 Tax=Oleiphilus messinensis TaxID=141451 RepID=A0A1Y0IFC8_9GAMM|nr:VOC family protein [Oleiphilus messinensis]ARU58073.1 glyoxalase/bleomycin resistance protein/dioxygenase [Oleiphilus messinensis]
MKLSAARIFVRNIDEAKEFYQMLGLTLGSYNQEAGFCIFDTGETKLIVESVSTSAPQDEQVLVGRFTGLSFSTRDILQAHKNLVERGVKFSGSPEKQFWGGWLATLFDPDQNEVQLVQDPS